MNVKADHPVGVSLVLAKIEVGVRRLAKLAGDDEEAAEKIMREIEPIADRAAEKMRVTSRRGR